MSARSVTLRGRRAAEANMVDACVLTRRTAPIPLNESTGIHAPGTPTTIYTGKCEVQMPQSANRNPGAGDVEWTVQALVLKLPMSVVGAQVDDTVTITASQLDPDLVGRVLKVVSLAHKSHMTARRLACEEVTG